MTFDWKKLLQGIAPAIATALGGPLAGAAMQALSQAVLGKPDATTPEISAKLSTMTTDELLQVKTADDKFAEDMGKIGIDRARLALEDEQGARNLARTDHTADYLTWLYTLGYFGVLAASWMFPVPPNMAPTIHSLMGALTATQITIVHLYFGRARGNK